MAAFGAVIARGGQYGDVFGVFGIEDWRARLPAVEAAYGGFRADDLYPDALRALGALRTAGYRIAIVANQPASRTDELRAIGVQAEVIAMSAAMGVAKPDPAFFERALALMGADAPDVAYVGDRLDNDVLPAAALGLRTVWIRRGPWAVIAPDAGDAAHLVVDSLDELVERIGQAWE
ncbi:MAG TPA: HAD-IA family hydrolase [Candidatus Limnocylindria bacterium]|nr:HAD-IA family hydrolase [Candidatus Limnocylindria bacterium]